jgi:hypothetical protein
VGKDTVSYKVNEAAYCFPNVHPYSIPEKYIIEVPLF